LLAQQHQPRAFRAVAEDRLCGVAVQVTGSAASGCRPQLIEGSGALDRLLAFWIVHGRVHCSRRAAAAGAMHGSTNGPWEDDGADRTLRRMDTLVWGAVALVLSATAVLYASLVSQRVHERRLRARIAQTIHLTAVVRAFLAERRHPA
jgi:hypothetical protein